LTKENGGVGRLSGRRKPGRCAMTKALNLVTVETEVSSGGVHTASLKVSGGRPISSALCEAVCHLETAIDVLVPLASNEDTGDESVYPALIPVSIAKALIESAQAAVYYATRGGE
jgi:hypothetical protein